MNVSFFVQAYTVPSDIPLVLARNACAVHFQPLISSGELAILSRGLSDAVDGDDFDTAGRRCNVSGRLKERSPFG